MCSNSATYNSIQSPIISTGNQLLTPILSSFSTTSSTSSANALENNNELASPTTPIYCSNRVSYGISNIVINPPSLHSSNFNSSLTSSFNSSTNSTSFSQSSSSKRSNFNNSNPTSNSNHDYICLENDCLSNTSGIPYIVEKCISYIQEFGIDSEGIYRVPGHKQYTDSLFDDFINRQDSIDLKSYNTSQINVNIVATVIKEYFRHLKEPIFGSNLKEFTDLSKTHFNQNTNLLSQITQTRNNNNNNNNNNSSTSNTSQQTSRQVTPPSSIPLKKQLIGSPIFLTSDIQSPTSPNYNNNSLSASLSSPNLDKSQILSESSKLVLIQSIKEKFSRLNRVNYLTLRAIFIHLNQIASNSSKNNMDSTNLAICWWPTLLRPKFEDFNETEILRKTLQPFVKFIIDNAKTIFEETN